MFIHPYLVSTCGADAVVPARPLKIRALLRDVFSDLRQAHARYTELMRTAPQDDV